MLLAIPRTRLVVCQIVTNLSEYMEINQTQASSKIGGPHGSILGPTLFTLYVNDSPDFITAGELYMLADNTAGIFAVTQ